MTPPPPATPMILWILFGAIVSVMMMLDLGVLHRKAHTIAFKEALITSMVWIATAMVFNAMVLYWRGVGPGLEFLTGYVVEMSLSVDNLFVFILIFASFKVSPGLRHKVLFWGILGALIMRAIFIFVGVALIRRFDWILYVFGAILIVSAVKMLRGEAEEVDIERHWVLRLVRRFLPISKSYDGHRFFTRHGGRRLATPLLVVLIMVETTDVIFAVDSIPAVLAITLDPFVVYTSNVFAILGLRSMFFAIQGLMERLRFLHYGLAAILGFVGAKLVLHGWVHIHPMVTLGVISSVLIAAMLASLIIKPSQGGAPDE